MSAIILGLVTGLVLGITGAGGGILAVPALIVGLGLNITTASPVALIAVGLAALVGAADGLRKHLVRYKAAFFMAAIGILFSKLGMAIAQIINGQLLTSLFAALMVYIALRLLRQTKQQTASASTPPHNPPCQLNPETGRLRWTSRCAIALGSIGALTGLFAGMLGVGGGFIIVPALKRFTNIPLQGIISTSLMLIALVSAGAVTTALLKGFQPPPLGLLFAFSAVGGMLFARKISHSLPDATVQTSFAITTLVVAGILLYRVWIN